MSILSPCADEWRPVPTHPGYSVTADGKIRGPSGRVLKPMPTKSSHLYVLTPLPRRPRKLFVHRAVLLAFVGFPEPEEEARHLDGIPTHNSLGNLCWGTRVEQEQDKARHGTKMFGERRATAKLTEEQVTEIRQRIGTMSLRALGEEYGVSHTAIRRAGLGLNWTHMESEARHGER